MLTLATQRSKTQLRAQNMADKPQLIEFAARSCNYTIFDTKWIPSSARFVSLGAHARNTGALEICELDNGKINVVQTVRFGYGGSVAMRRGG